MIVEDNALNIKLFCDLLEAHGHQTEAVTDSRQALDTALDRQVALTFIDPEATLSDDEVQEILSRTLKLSRLDMPGVARVLDVASTGSGGLVVSEWIRGGSLPEVAETSPSPIGGARAIQSLAAAAEAAHRSGVAAGDARQRGDCRIRIGGTGCGTDELISLELEQLLQLAELRLRLGEPAEPDPREMGE